MKFIRHASALLAYNLRCSRTAIPSLAEMWGRHLGRRYRNGRANSKNALTPEFMRRFVPIPVQIANRRVLPVAVCTLAAAAIPYQLTMSAYCSLQCLYADCLQFALKTTQQLAINGLQKLAQDLRYK